LCGGGILPSLKMFTMTRALEDTLLQQFIYQKLEIAYAIYKPFPFLEGLRDNFFITETMYRESMEACRNQVPVPRVVYNILTHLEKNFSLSFLEMLFSRINLHEYPHLMTILKGFRSGTRLLEYLLGYKIMPEVAMLKVWVGFQPRGIMHFKYPTNNGNKPSSGKSPGEKRKCKEPIWSLLGWIRCYFFGALTLCQAAKDILDHKKICRMTLDLGMGHLYLTGSSEKCIRNEEGVWFTPKEFEMEGKRTKTRKWKQTVLCRGKPLEELLKKGLLLCPPRISVKREVKSRPLVSVPTPAMLRYVPFQWENAKECEVCCTGGPLLCCDTCPRAFHEDCHIPSAEAERSPWSCTFCQIKESSGRQQRHRESEVLERQMQPEEQVKCEFLLLKAYCHPQSSFFAETPHNIMESPFKEAMWLDLIKERLTEKVYTVAWFVRDMRLIFRNHKTFYKASDFGQIGLDLEAEFEKDLKEVFIFCKANESSFQTL
uniref:SP110 nuclear body protein n=1 Tax=Ursus maritimus TaxID=29073 RepID=A0A452URA8_URSMA